MGRLLGDHDARRRVDVDHLAVDPEAAVDTVVIAADPPLVAVRTLRPLLDPFSPGPGPLSPRLRVSSIQLRGTIWRPSTAPPSRSELAETREVAQRHAESTAGDRRTEPIERDVGVELGAHRLPDLAAQQFGERQPADAFEHPAE